MTLGEAISAVGVAVNIIALILYLQDRPGGRHRK